MTLEIKSPPVLTGKAAHEFHKRWAESKESKSAEYVQESVRTTKEFYQNITIRTNDDKFEK